jgi:hypothetical protein
MRSFRFKILFGDLGDDPVALVAPRQRITAESDGERES